jgi:tetratricopeptide (TPR) repeat protein
MHAFLMLTAALFTLFTGTESNAQNQKEGAIAAEIREQEIAVESARSRQDGEAWLKLAVLHQDAAQYRDSERAYRKAIAFLKSGDRAPFADALDHMGTMYVESGRLSKAEVLERKALKIREDQNDLLGIGLSHMHLGVLLLGRHDLPSAEAEAGMAVSLLAPGETRHAIQTAATPEEKMTALIDLSLVRCARGNSAAAVPDLKRALRLAHTNYTANSIPVGFLDFLLGYALWKSGDRSSAGEMMRTGTQELATQLGWGHPTYIQALRQYRLFLIQAGHAIEADQLGANIATLEKGSKLDHPKPNRTESGLGQLH